MNYFALRSGSDRGVERTPASINYLFCVAKRKLKHTLCLTSIIFLMGAMRFSFCLSLLKRVLYTGVSELMPGSEGNVYKTFYGTCLLKFLQTLNSLVQINAFGVFVQFLIMPSHEILYKHGEKN